MFSGWRRGRGRVAALALMLAAVAIAVRVLIPQGFMVVAGAHPGAVAIALCPSQAAPAASAHHHETRDAAPAPDDADGGPDEPGPCAFAGLHAFVPIEPVAVAALDTWPQGGPPPSPRAPARIGRAPAARPPSTGPPGQA